MMKRSLMATLGILVLTSGSTQAQSDQVATPDCIPQVALDAYVQRSIERKADIYASLSPEPGSTIFLGSSIIEEGPWNALFPNKAVLNWGISAETTEDLMGRLDTVIKATPAEIILYTGGNDLSRLGRTPDQALENIELIVSRLEDALPETDIYLNTLFPREEQHAQTIIQVNDGIRELAKTSDIILIDGYPLFLGDNGAVNPIVSNDSIHLSGAAYQQWAGLIVKVMDAS
ncbi:MAG: GDSL-type esterase/lipase family protein [Pseudomonadota bacterium]